MHLQNGVTAHHVNPERKTANMALRTMMLTPKHCLSRQPLIKLALNLGPDRQPYRAPHTGYDRNGETEPHHPATPSLARHLLDISHINTAPSSRSRTRFDTQDDRPQPPSITIAGALVNAPHRTSLSSQDH